MRLSATRLAAIAHARGLGDRLWDLAGMPSLSLQFAATRSTNDVVSGQNLITFSRLSDGTTTNSAGQIEIVPAGVPRFTHDPVTLESLGLLVEEQRVQILQLTDALSTQTKTVTAVAHTLSFYGTGTVALSGAHTATVVGTGAYPARTISTFTPASGALTLTVTGTVQFGQLEIGGFATSYIPNSGTSQVVRAADVPVITGASFSSWYRQDEGSFYTDTNLLAGVTSTNRFVFEANDGVPSTGDKWDLRRTGGSAYRTQIRDGGVSNSDQTISTSANPLRIAVAADSSAVFASANGVATSSVAKFPAGFTTVDRLFIGGGIDTSSLQTNGTIARLDFYPRRLPNAILQELSR
jgi:hypothetical protein